MYKFRFFRAIEDPAACEKFKEGHRKILADYGIENVTTNSEKWHQDPDVFVITAEDDQGEFVGGIRLHRSFGDKELPIESAIGEMDEKIYPLVKKDAKKGTAEVCGLWNAKRVFGKGVSPLLARTAVAFADFINVETVYCLTAKYTISIATSIGFVVRPEVGNEGTFQYPIETHLASVMHINDLKELKNADPEQRKRILSLRRKPNQDYIELSQKKNVMISYQNDYEAVSGKVKSK